MCLLHGRRFGPLGFPVAFETEFGWVLAGETESCAPADLITTYHTSLISGDDILRKFWEIEERPMSDSVLSLQRNVPFCATFKTTTFALTVEDL